MKAITKYVATDGSEWNSEEAAIERDVLNAIVRELEAMLGARVTRGRRVIDPTIWADVKTSVVRLCRERYPSEPVFQHDANEIAPMSYAGRFLDDVGGPLRRIWLRFMCQAGEWEYEQPYFALNPEKFKPADFAEAPR